MRRAADPKSAAMTSDNSTLCEVRTPTFRRPTLLKRALISLTAQTYTNWRCIVFDDCPNESARSIVDDINDPRILYSHNPTQLGAIGNIDKSFAKQPFLGGRYAFVLEDDNYLLPMHIESAVTILERNGLQGRFLQPVLRNRQKPRRARLYWRSTNAQLDVQTRFEQPE